jgi:hypothetical protein
LTTTLNASLQEKKETPLKLETHLFRKSKKLLKICYNIRMGEARNPLKLAITSIWEKQEIP